MSRFNLLCDAWIPIKGRCDPIKVCEIVQIDILALDAPRADFNAALMQFLIGIVQTVFAPQTPHIKTKIEIFTHSFFKRTCKVVFPTPVGMNRLAAKS